MTLTLGGGWGAIEVRCVPLVTLEGLLTYPPSSCGMIQHANDAAVVIKYLGFSSEWLEDSCGTSHAYSVNTSFHHPSCVRDLGQQLEAIDCCCSSEHGKTGAVHRKALRLLP